MPLNFDNQDLGVGFMRKISVILIIGLLLGCSGSDKPLAPTVPESLLGEYTGTISYWRFKGTDSVVTASAEIEFLFDSDSTYSYNVSIEDGCGYMGTGYEYDDGSLELWSITMVAMMCIFNPLEELYGDYRVTVMNSTMLFYQELPEFDLVRTIELNRVSQ